MYEFTPAVLRTVRLQIVASLVLWNSKAVGSAPDQTATFPEKSLVRLLAVVVGVDVGVMGSRLYLCMFLWTLMSSYNRLRLVGGLVVFKMDLVR